MAESSELLVVVKGGAGDTEYPLSLSDSDRALELFGKLDGNSCSQLDVHFVEDQLVLEMAGGRDGKYIVCLNVDFTEQVWQAKGRLRNSTSSVEMSVFGRVEVLENKYLLETDEAKDILRYFVETHGGRSPLVDWYRTV